LKGFAVAETTGWNTCKSESDRPVWRCSNKELKPVIRPISTTKSVNRMGGIAIASRRANAASVSVVLTVGTHNPFAPMRVFASTSFPATCRLTQLLIWRFGLPGETGPDIDRNRDRNSGPALQ
jgi:hypothetical protein